MSQIPFCLPLPNLHSGGVLTLSYYLWSEGNLFGSGVVGPMLSVSISNPPYYECPILPLRFLVRGYCKTEMPAPWTTIYMCKSYQTCWRLIFTFSHLSTLRWNSQLPHNYPASCNHNSRTNHQNQKSSFLDYCHNLIRMESSLCDWCYSVDPDLLAKSND